MYIEKYEKKNWLTASGYLDYRKICSQRKKKKRHNIPLLIIGHSNGLMLKNRTLQQV